MNTFHHALRRLIGSIHDSRACRALLFACDAYVTGARLIPLGDNGALLRTLAARSPRAPAAPHRRLRGPVSQIDDLDFVRTQSLTQEGGTHPRETGGAVGGKPFDAAAGRAARRRGLALEPHLSQHRGRGAGG